MKRLFFCKTEKIESAFGGALYYRVPEGYTRLDIEEIIVLQNDVMTDAGGASINYEIVSQKRLYADSDLPAGTVQNSTPIGNANGVLLGSVRGINDLYVLGGDAIKITVDTKRVVDAVVYVGFVGYKEKTK